MVDNVDLLVVGGPTHAHGMSRRQTRVAAENMAAKLGSTLELEPGAVEFGLREWFRTLRVHDGLVTAAFDTRGNGPSLFTGRASRRIERQLRKLGAHVASTKSFFVEGNDRLAPNQIEKARAWGLMLAVVTRIEPATDPHLEPRR